jgi:hypothetical protein
MLLAHEAALLYALKPERHFRALGETPDPWQEQVLRRSNKPRNIICCTSRQAGKSTVISVKASNRACYHPESLVIVTAPVERQARELYRKIKVCIQSTPGAPKIEASSVKEMELANGSRIVCLPGKAEFLAGYSAPSLAIIDEACYAKDNLYNVVSPMMAVSSGELVLISTPFIRSGFFYNIWNDLADDSWDRYEIPATSVPRINQSFLDKERRRLGEWWFNSQYMCRFQEAQDSLITNDMIMRAFRHSDYVSLIKDGADPLYIASQYKALEV